MTPNPTKLNRKGINYDVGTYTRGQQGPSSRERFDPFIVRREMEIIKNDLHCNAIRISGQDISRLAIAAEFALQQGLEVWFSPAWVDANEQELLDYFAVCAKTAESLRQQYPSMVFVAGCELTFFMKGLVAGDTAFDRIETMMKPWRLLKSTLMKGSFHKRLNAFLHKAAAVIREQFHGPLTYASGAWEQVNWEPFDVVSVDFYRDALNRNGYRDKLQAYFKPGKPVVITEFGCCTYAGAEDKGGYGWAIVDRSQTTPRLKGPYSRDEHGQAAHMVEVLAILTEEKVDGAFWFTFYMETYPFHEDDRYDLDRASYGVVRALEGRTGSVYPDMPWEPKQSFAALADYYDTH